MIRISLSTEDKTALTVLRRNQKSNVGERAYYVLLSDSGKSVSEIAQHLGRNGHTIRLWLKRYLNEGVKGLQTKKPPGRPAKKAPAIELQIQELLDKSPQDYGYQEAGWQINLLRDWLSKKGINACDNTIVKSLNKLGYVYKRFSKTLPENAPTPEQKKARIREIVGEISQFAATDTEIMFVDESHFSNQPYVTRGWFKCGKKK